MTLTIGWDPVICDQIRFGSITFFLLYDSDAGIQSFICDHCPQESDRHGDKILVVDLIHIESLLPEQIHTKDQCSTLVFHTEVNDTTTDLVALVFHKIGIMERKVS